MLGLGSSAQLGVGLAIILHNKFTAPANQIGASMAKLMGGARNMRMLGGTLQAVGAGMMAIGVAGVAGIRAAVQEFTKFEDVMNSVKSISGATRVEYDKLWASALKQGTPLGFQPLDVAKAQLELAKAGLAPKDIESSTKAVLALGAASETAIGGERGAAVMLSDIWTTFKRQGVEAAEVANVLTSAANRSTIDVKDLYESMKYVGGQAVSMKIPLQEAAAVIATLGQSGLKGSIAGVSYANMLTYLNKATGKFGLKKQKEALAMLGLTGNEFIDMDPSSKRFGSLKSMGQIMKIIANQTKNMLPKDRQMIFEAIFGVRAKKMVDRMVDSLGDYDKMLQNINEDNKMGIALTVAGQKADDLQGDIDRMKAAWSGFKIAIGKAFEPFLRAVLPILTKFLVTLTDWINDSALARGIVVITGAFFGLLVPLGAAVSMLGTLMTLAGTGKLFGFLRMLVGLRGAGGIGGILGGLFRGAGGLLGGLRVLGPFFSIIFRITRGLLSWPLLIADIASTLIFGKGIFQFMWEAITDFTDALLSFNFDRIMEEMMNWFIPGRRQGLWDSTWLGRTHFSASKKREAAGSNMLPGQNTPRIANPFYPEQGRGMAAEGAYSTYRYQSEASIRAQQAREFQARNANVPLIALHVHPTTGDKTTRYNIDTRDQRSLNAYGVK